MAFVKVYAWALKCTECGALSEESYGRSEEEDTTYQTDNAIASLGRGWITGRGVMFCPRCAKVFGEKLQRIVKEGK